MTATGHLVKEIADYADNLGEPLHVFVAEKIESVLRREVRRARGGKCVGYVGVQREGRSWRLGLIQIGPLAKSPARFRLQDREQYARVVLVPRPKRRRKK